MRRVGALVGVMRDPPCSLFHDLVLTPKSCKEEIGGFSVSFLPCLDSQVGSPHPTNIFDEGLDEELLNTRLATNAGVLDCRQPATVYCSKCGCFFLSFVHLNNSYFFVIGKRKSAAQLPSTFP